MIRIERPHILPGFVDGGEAATQALHARRLADPLAGASRTTAFKFQKAIYGPRRIKTQLSKAQFDKCCYCENYFSGNYPGDVEHFRPKGRVQQARGASPTYPGYFFLAYRWENLLFSCFSCNAASKRDLFPVTHARAATPAELVAEGAMLIDPTLEDPRQHITFDFITPKPVTVRGETTIKILRLDRAELYRPRLSHLKQLDTLLRLAAKPNTPEHAADRTYATVELNAALRPEAPFSSMAQDYLTHHGWPQP